MCVLVVVLHLSRGRLNLTTKTSPVATLNLTSSPSVYFLSDRSQTEGRKGAAQGGREEEIQAPRWQSGGGITHSDLGPHLISSISGFST